MTKNALFEYIGYILQAGHLGYNYNSISDFYRVVATRDDNLSVTEYSSNEHVLLEFKMRDGDTDDGGLLTDDKLGCLNLVTDDIVKRLHVTTLGVFSTSDVSDDHIRDDGLGVDDGVEIKLVDNAAIVDSRYLGRIPPTASPVDWIS